MPCTAFEPYNAVAGPRIASMALACSEGSSKSSFTLQKPVGRVATPSSRIRKLPQEPGPVSTGERMAVRCSWPLPRESQTPGICVPSSWMWVAFSSAMLSAPMRVVFPARSRAGTG